MRLIRNAGSALLAATVLLGACGDSNDPTPFDPAGIAGDLAAGTGLADDVMLGPVGTQFYLVGEYLTELTSPSVPALRPTAALLADAARGHDDTAARERLVATLKQVARARADVPGAAVVLPEEVLGTTFVWDPVEETYVASDRTDAPDNGVRFVLYTLDPVTFEPAEGLDEVGYLDLLDLSTASADIGRLILVSGGVTYLDYRVTARGTENDADIDVVGFISDGDDRMNFDLSNEITFSETSTNLGLDYELEFSNVGATLRYIIEVEQSMAGSEATVEMSLRGRHGYVDLTVTQSGSGDEMHGTVLVEVNGEDFASAECTGEEACTLARMNGDPLTPDEEEALQGLLGLYTYGFFITSELMAPVGAFFPLL